MQPTLKPLFEHAFRRAPAREANSAIQSVREEDGERSRSFVMGGDPSAGIEWLEKELLPRLVYHLESLGVRPPGYAGIFVSLFAGEELLFLRTRDVMAFASEALHLTADQMYARWGTGELRHAVRPGETEDRPVLALPPGSDE